nr:hypothetical protein [Tanacetum cinerariifolium]
MELCTKLSKGVLNLVTTKTAQAKEISSLKRRVKRLEKKKKLRTHGLKRLYKIGLYARVESSVEEQNYELAARLQEEEQGELTIKEKSRLSVELKDKRKKHFAKLIIEGKRRKRPTKA